MTSDNGGSDAGGARLTSRIWVTFSFTPAGAAVPEATGSGAPLARDVYVVEEVVTVRGAGLAGVGKGWTATRVEARIEAAVTDAPVSLVGTTQHLLYTDGEQQAELARISRTAPGEVVVLIPISKSEAWWALPQDQRRRHFHRVPGHVGAGYASRIARRLYHARYLPGSSWDFLTYFEMQPQDAGAFRQLLGELRDPEKNNEWAFVEREVEVWMRRT
jgi:hypothetical protein